MIELHNANNQRQINTGSAYKNASINTLLRAINEAGDEKFIDVVKNNAPLISSIDQLRSVFENKKPRPKSTIEISTGISLISYGASLYWESVRVLPKLMAAQNRAGKFPDFFTSLNIDKCMLTIEPHSFHRKISSAHDANKTADLKMDVEKRVGLYGKHNRLKHLIIADFSADEIENITGRNVLEFCDYYVHISNRRYISRKIEARLPNLFSDTFDYARALSAQFYHPDMHPMVRNYWRTFRVIHDTLGFIIKNEHCSIERADFMERKLVDHIRLNLLRNCHSIDSNKPNGLTRIISSAANTCFSFTQDAIYSLLRNRRDHE